MEQGRCWPSPAGTHFQNMRFIGVKHPHSRTGLEQDVRVDRRWSISRPNWKAEYCGLSVSLSGFCQAGKTMYKGADEGSQPQDQVAAQLVAGKSGWNLKGGYPAVQQNHGGAHSTRMHKKRAMVTISPAAVSCLEGAAARGVQSVS